MKLIKKYNAEYAEYQLAGEVATLQRSEDSTKSWGFTTNKGYNTWEGDAYATRAEAYQAMKSYNDSLLNELKFA